MGACGGTREASKTAPATAYMADFNRDGVVDFMDLGIGFADWLVEGCCLPVDMDRNGFVNLRDFVRFGSDWLMREEQ